MSHKLYGFREILELLTNKKGTLIVAGIALGFFTGSRNIIPFSVDLSDFCRSFRDERDTTIKIYISHQVLLVNEVYNVIKRNSLFDIRTTIWYKIIFRTQNRMNCKLCRIIRREYGFIVVIHRFLQTEKLINFDKGWALKSDRRQVLLRNFTSGWVRWQLEEASCCCWGRFCKEWNFRVANWCFYKILTDSYLLYLDRFSLFGQNYKNFHIWEVFPF